MMWFMSETYHLRRIERDMPDRNEQLAVIRGQKFLSLAMARADEPYLVSLNYAYDEGENCFYAHSAAQGKKIDFLRVNPRFWAQIIEDRGYVPGECAHAYRSVMFSGRAEFVEDIEQKQRALSMMIEHADPSPRRLKELLAKTDIRELVILRLRVERMSGKSGR